MTSTKAIIHGKEGEGVSITVPSCDSYIDDIVESLEEGGLACKVVNSSDIPPDRKFRDVWEFNNGEIVINLDKAKDKAHDARRARRSVLFKKIDGDSPYITLNEDGEKKRTEIKVEDDYLQILINDCTTPEELKEVVERNGLL